MKINGRLRVYILLAIISTLCSVLAIKWEKYFSNNYKPKFIGAKVYKFMDPKDVYQIKIDNPVDKKNIVLKRDNYKWVISSHFGYPVNDTKVNTFIDTIYSAKVIQDIHLNQKTKENLDLTAKKGIKVSLFNKDGKTINNTLFGAVRTEDSGSGNSIDLGRYLISPYYNDIVFTDNVLNELNFDSLGWLDDNFPRIRGIRKIEAKRGGVTMWTISRDNQNSKFKLLEDGKLLELNSSINLSSDINKLKFNDVIPASDIKGTGLNNPAIIMVTTFSNEIYRMKIGTKKGNNYFIRWDSFGSDYSTYFNEKYSNWIYLVDERRISSFLRSGSQLATSKENNNLSKMDTMPAG